LLLGSITAESSQLLSSGSASLIQLHHIKSLSGASAYFLDRTPLLGRQQETINDRIAALL
jgi:uncharacterized protein (DUF1810 family)